MFSSCGYVRGTVQSTVPVYESVITPEFKKFLQTKQNLAVVLRVPSASSTATQSDLTDNSTYYAQIEKQLMLKGFEVKDRGLLNALLVAGTADYQEIAQKTNADVIIEIISIYFPRTYNGKIKMDKQNSMAPYREEKARKAIGIESAVIEYKLVQVQNGKTGVVSTFHYYPEIEPFYFDKLFGYIGWDKSKTIFDSLKLNINKVAAVDAFCEKLAILLKGN